MRVDAVIIGSGISALTAAALLGKKGYRVLVIEQNRRLGGSLKRFKRQGIAFDVGFHYTGCLGENDILHRLWSYCGSLDNLNVLSFPEHGSDRFYLQKDGKTVDAYFSYPRLVAELKSNFPAEATGIDTYFSTIKEICQNIPFYNLDLPVTDFLQGYRGSKISVKDFLRQNISDSGLQSILASPSMLYGISTDNVSIDTHAMVAHGYYQGAYSVEGGGQAIVDAFVQTCGNHGVEFKSGEKVDKIFTDQSGISGILTRSGEKIACKYVIYTGHPSHLIGMTDDSAFRPAYKKRLLQLKNTVSMNIVFGLLEDPPQSLEWNNHVYLPDGPNPLDNEYRNVNKRLLMVTCTERKSFSLPGKSKSVILLQPEYWEEAAKFGVQHSSERTADYEKHKEKLCDSMIEQAKKYLGEKYSNLKPLAVGTPLTMKDELDAPEGCAYGACHSLDQYTPDVRTRVPGLLLSGQSTLMTGVAGASLAGLISTGHITGVESLWREIQTCS